MPATTISGKGVSSWSFSLAAWKQVAMRTWTEASDDNIGLVAAGVAFYGFLALVPLLGAIVLSYGIVAEPATVIRDMRQLTSVLPVDAAKLIGAQLMNVVEASGEKKGLGLVLAFCIALFGARNGAAAIITALNIAYEEKETRSLIRQNLLALAMTAAGIGVAIVALVAIAALGHLGQLLPRLPEWVLALGKIGTYAVLACVAAAGAATLYRYGPARENVAWVWITPGSVFAALLWLILTAGFGIYVANFGNYNAIYGSIATVVVMLTWLYLSSYILLIGAELNSEFERQTLADSREGTERPRNVGDSEVASTVSDQPEVAPVAAAEAAELSVSPALARNAGGAEVGKHYLTARVAARAAQLAGFGRVDALTSGFAAVGLARIRRGERPFQGVALLAAAGAIAWLRRSPPRPAGKIRAVLFDLDGTLVDSNDFHVEVWHDIFRAHGHHITRAAIHEQIGKGGDMLVPSLFPELSQPEHRRLADEHGEVFKRRYLKKVRPFPGARQLMEQVHRLGQRVALASSASREELEHYIDLLDARDLVDAATSIDDVANSKPAPDIFALALAKAGVTPDEAVVVGDTPYDIRAAAGCGVVAVAVRSGGFDDQQLSGAVARYDDVADLLSRFEKSPLAH